MKSGHVVALSTINLEVGANEIVGLIGANGAGGGSRSGSSSA